MILWLMIIFSVRSFSQGPKETLTRTLEQIDNNSPADQLFLHLDRNFYHGGDTIRFRAYIRDRQTGLFETKSISLYTLLLNPDHMTLDSARFRISYSTASGWLKVPDNVSAGYYFVISFTSDQMNYDPEFAFTAPVRIDRINPARSNAEHESQIKESDDLRFLPEGGTFILGVKQRLAFNAVNSSGRNISVSGDITDQDGNKISEFKSGEYGPGIIEFTPAAGKSYFAKAREAEFRNFSWPLPQAEKSGVSIRVNNNHHGLLDITVSGKGISDKEYFLTVTMNNVLLFSRELKSDTLFNARISTAEIPAGTAIVTLYDNELNPVAERLILINENKKMNVRIEVTDKTIRPGKETELKINTTDEKGNNLESIVSVSVIDSLSGYSSTIPFPDIESLFLYDNGFYNNLPQNIRCTGLRSIDNNSTDLLMMTYGWRKYTLKESEFVTQKKQSNNYDHLKISNPGKEKKGRQEINLISPEGGGPVTLGIDTSRVAILPYDSLETYVRQIMILPDESASRNTNPVAIEFPENKEYIKQVKLIKGDSSYLLNELASVDNEIPVYNPDSAIMIEPVTIKGQKKEEKKYVDKSSHEFQYSGAYTLYSKDFEKSDTFEDILYKFGPYFIDKRNKLVVLRPIQHKKISGLGYGYRPALVVVDNVPIINLNYLPIADMPASEIASITVLKGPQGFVRYGVDAANGVVIVTTKVGNRIDGGVDPEERSWQGDNNLQAVRLFRTEVEYYIPTKEQSELVPEYQFRPTLLWKSDVYLDGSGPVKLRYPNNMKNGSVMIFVNGVSFTNLIGSGEYNYSVKEAW